MDNQQIITDSSAIQSNKPTILSATSGLGQEPASDWAQETQSALGNTSAGVVESSSVPGEASHVIQPHETTGLDPAPKTQAHVDALLGTQSTVSTPGVQLPGAWNDKPATATQMLSDAGNALSAAGTAAYNALPESMKGAFGSTTTSTSPIQTTTNHETTSPTDNITTTAKSTLSTVAEGASVAAGAVAAGASLAYAQLSSAATTAANTDTARSATATASNAVNQISDTLAGTNLTTAGVDKSKEVVGDSQTASLPSQELFGATPMLGGARDGAGALPGHRDESGVAILPDDKEALENKPADYDAFSNPPDVTATPATAPTAKSTTETLADSARATTAGVLAAGAAAGATAQHVYEKPHEYIPGMKAPLNDGHTMPAHKTDTLPSEDVRGQMPLSGPMDGVGALPGSKDEEGVAILPAEKAIPEPLANTGLFAGETSENTTGKTNQTLASPYNSQSPYSNAEANTISPPSGAPGTSSSTTEKAEGKLEEVKDKINPGSSKPSENTTSEPARLDTTDSRTSASGASETSEGGSPTKKKASFMDKLKGQSKILTGKLAKNPEKIEEGKALKDGTTGTNA